MKRLRDADTKYKVRAITIETKVLISLRDNLTLNGGVS
jgi:hypothetical protein